MRASLNEIAALLIRYSGVPWFVRGVLARSKATILVYHDPTPETLDRHLTYLARRYNVISLDDLVATIEARDSARIAPRSLVITLDDGHAGNARLGETFRRHGVRPTIYVCSQIVGTARRYWFTELPNGDVQALKRVSNAERVRALEEATGFTPTREYPDRDGQALSLGQLAAAEVWADIGAHSRSHPILTSCSDEALEDEVTGSRLDLDAILGSPRLHFAYPNGTYADREVECAERAGFASARTIDFGWNNAETDPFRLKSACVSDDASINLLAAQVSGAAALLKALRHRLRC